MLVTGRNRPSSQVLLSIIRFSRQLKRYIPKDHCAAVCGQLEEQAAIVEAPGCRIVEMLHKLPLLGIGSAGQRRCVNIKADVPHPGTGVGAQCLATVDAAYAYASIQHSGFAREVRLARILASSVLRTDVKS